MKVVEINSFGNFSTGNIACDIAEEVQRRGDECLVLYARGNIRKTVKSKRISSKLDVLGHTFLARIFDSAGLHSKYQTRKVLKFLDQYKPDVVHLHNLHGYYINYPMIFNYLYEHKEIKVVWTLHDCWPFTGHCCYFSRSKCGRWRNGCFNCPSKKDYPSSYFFDRSKKNYNKKKDIFTKIETDRMIIITPSNWLKEIAQASYLRKYRINTVHNGVDINKFAKKNESNQKSKSKIILGVASVWDERKGLNTFIELSKVLEENYKIVIIGKIFDNVKLPSNVMHISRTENTEELVKWYSSCDVFLNPTLDENYPTVNVEAQCCSAKVLCFDSGGSSETNIGNLYLIDGKENKPYKIFQAIKMVEGKKIEKIDFSKADRKRMSEEYYDVLKLNGGDSNE